MARLPVRSFERWRRAACGPSGGSVALALAVAAPLLLAYVPTLAPGLLGGDAGELQLTAQLLSLAHPTGYPLNILLDRLWTLLLPLGAPAWRLNLLSALETAGAAALAALTVRRLGARPGAAWLAGLALGLGEPVWRQALVADKYALNALLASFLVWALVRAARGGGWRPVALAVGLGLAHHRTTLALLPSVALAAWLARDRLARDGGEVARLAALALLPLLLYLYLPFAAARPLPPGGWRLESPGDYLVYFADPAFTGRVQLGPDSLARFGGYLGWLGRQFGPVGIALIGLGALALGHPERPGGRSGTPLAARPSGSAAARAPGRLGLLAVLGLAWGSVAALTAQYRVPDEWVFFLPSFVVLAPLVGLGAATLADGLARPTADAARRWTGALVVGLLTAGLALTAWLPAARVAYAEQVRHLPLDPYRQNLKRGDLAERLVALAGSQLGPGAVVVVDWEQATSLWYAQHVRGELLGVQVRQARGDFLEEVRAALRLGDPVYVGRPAEGLDALGSRSAEGPLLRVGPPQVEPLRPPLARFGAALALVGAAVESVVPAGGPVAVQLRWQALDRIEGDLSVSVRVVDAAGREVAQQDFRHPALGTYPTSRWQVGEVVGDFYDLRVPEDATPGPSALRVIVYRPEPLRNLPVVDAAGREQGEALTLPGPAIAEPGALWRLLRAANARLGVPLP